MKYAYEDLGDEQFEKLIVFLCQRLLGISVQGFAKGPDGGRDAKFVGTAELHPSKAAPWIGTTVIQAKHTNGYNRNSRNLTFTAPQAQTTCWARRFRVLRNCGRASSLIITCSLPTDGWPAMPRARYELLFQLSAASRHRQFISAAWSNWKSG